MFNCRAIYCSIDGKHAIIQRPVKSGSQYFNYKSFFNIVLFAMVDTNCNLIFVDVGFQGRISDGGIFKNTQLFTNLKDGHLSIPPLPGQPTLVPQVILGDEAFSLIVNLMKPFSGVHPPGSKERIFNYRLSRGRRVVENAFGIMSSVFRVLRKSMILKPEKAEFIVMACVHLRNFFRNTQISSNLYCSQGVLDNEVDGQVIPGMWKNDTEMSSLLSLRKLQENHQQVLKKFDMFFLDIVLVMEPYRGKTTMLDF